MRDGAASVCHVLINILTMPRQVKTRLIRRTYRLASSELYKVQNKVTRERKKLSLLFITNKSVLV